MNLSAFIGEWSMEAIFPGLKPGGAQGRVTFEWMGHDAFLVERWKVNHPQAPNGIAFIGPGEGREVPFLQHYFDERGVARVYEMSFEHGIWKLWRIAPDFSPLSFWQRFAGAFSPDGGRIDGTWETSQDEGASWKHDFDLIYRRI